MDNQPTSPDVSRGKQNVVDHAGNRTLISALQAQRLPVRRRAQLEGEDRFERSTSSVQSAVFCQLNYSPKKRVRVEGVEPSSSESKSAVVPLDAHPLAERRRRCRQ